MFIELFAALMLCVLLYYGYYIFKFTAKLFYYIYKFGCREDKAVIVVVILLVVLGFLALLEKNGAKFYG